MGAVRVVGAALCLLILLIGCQTVEQNPVIPIQKNISSYEIPSSLIKIPELNETFLETEIAENNSEEEQIQQLVPNDQLPVRNFTIEELEEFINRMEKKENRWIKDTDNSTYVNELTVKNQEIYVSNYAYQMRNWVIQVVNDPNQQLKNMQDFVNFVSMPNWQGYRYYINETSYVLLHEKMNENELNAVMIPQYHYQQNYVEDSLWVDEDHVENPLKTANGDVFEYRLSMLMLDRFDNPDGNWESYKYIYKIPCSQDLVIYNKVRFSMDYGGNGFVGQGKIGTLNNWYRGDSLVRPNMINQTEQIMEFCGIQPSMYDKAKFPSINVSKELALNWYVYFRMQCNYSMTVNVNYEKKPDEQDEYTIQGINITFVHFDSHFDDFYRDSNLMLKIEINESGKVYDYDETYVKAGLSVKAGELYTRYIDKKKDISGKNLSLIFKPYIGWKDLAEPKRYYIGPPIEKKIS
jgi:hypothetical protein